MDWFCLFAFNLFPIMLLAVLNLQLVFTLRRIVRRDSSASSTLVQNGAADSEQPTEQQEERNANANHQGQIVRNAWTNGLFNHFNSSQINCLPLITISLPPFS
jgi:hypothetical protein